MTVTEDCLTEAKKGKCRCNVWDSLCRLQASDCSSLLICTPAQHTCVAWGVSSYAACLGRSLKKQTTLGKRPTGSRFPLNIRLVLCLSKLDFLGVGGVVDLVGLKSERGSHDSEKCTCCTRGTRVSPLSGRGVTDACSSCGSVIISFPKLLVRRPGSTLRHCHCRAAWGTAP